MPRKKGCAEKIDFGTRSISDSIYLRTYGVLAEEDFFRDAARIQHLQQLIAGYDPAPVEIHDLEGPHRAESYEVLEHLEHLRQLARAKKGAEERGLTIELERLQHRVRELDANGPFGSEEIEWETQYLMLWRSLRRLPTKKEFEDRLRSGDVPPLATSRQGVNQRIGKLGVRFADGRVLKLLLKAHEHASEYGKRTLSLAEFADVLKSTLFASGCSVAKELANPWPHHRLDRAFEVVTRSRADLDILTSVVYRKDGVEVEIPEMPQELRRFQEQPPLSQEDHSRFKALFRNWVADSAAFIASHSVEYRLNGREDFHCISEAMRRLDYLWMAASSQIREHLEDPLQDNWLADVFAGLAGDSFSPPTRMKFLEVFLRENSDIGQGLFRTDSGRHGLQVLCNAIDALRKENQAETCGALAQSHPVMGEFLGFLEPYHWLSIGADHGLPKPNHLEA